MNKLQRDLRLIEMQANMEKQASMTNKDIMAEMLTAGMQKEAEQNEYINPYKERTGGGNLGSALGRGLKTTAKNYGNLARGNWGNIYNDSMAAGKGIYDDIAGKITPRPDASVRDWMKDSILGDTYNSVSDYTQDTLMKPGQWGTGTKAAVYGGGGLALAAIAALAAKKAMA